MGLEAGGRQEILIFSSTFERDLRSKNGRKKTAEFEEKLSGLLIPSTEATGKGDKRGCGGQKIREEKRMAKSSGLNKISGT